MSSRPALSAEDATLEASSTLMHMLAAFANTTCKSCGEKIKPTTEAYFDSLLSDGGRVFHCPRCAKSLRYHRKRALMRGEPMPASFDDVDERLANR